MPKHGKINSPAEADAMERKMILIIDKAFEGVKSKPPDCKRCDDSGYLHAWFQFRPGHHTKRDKTYLERVPNSPCWFLKLGSADPAPELELTPCIVRCLCVVGHSKPKAIPFANQFAP